MVRPNRTTEAEIRRRSNGRCEYCLFREYAAELPFHTDHIIAVKHGGTSDVSNLAWTCFSCNLRKGPNIAGIDPQSGELSRLFHPRTDDWLEHFYFDGPKLIGRTPIGRATITTLNINHPDSVAVRQALRDELEFPHATLGEN